MVCKIGGENCFKISNRIVYAQNKSILGLELCKGFLERWRFTKAKITEGFFLARVFIGKKLVEKCLKTKVLR